jgi:predicted KAP-like P-loop ATPase
MWPDNETRIDLLGFDFLVDELLVILRDRRLFPVTVGVAGDWGSGKTSLICMTEATLADDAKFLTVSFSPWRFEDYEDVKTALMAAVIGAAFTRYASLAPFCGARLRLSRLEVSQPGADD